MPTPACASAIQPCVGAARSSTRRHARSTSTYSAREFSTRQPGGLLAVGVERDAVLPLVTLVERAHPHAGRGRLRDEPADVGALDASRMPTGDQPFGGRRPARSATTRSAASIRCARRRTSATRASVDVDVAVADVAAKRRVGRISEAHFELLRRRFDDGHAYRRVVRVRGIGVDRRVNAREVAGAVQAPHELVELGDRIAVTRPLRPVVAHEVGGIARQPFDLELADMEHRSAVDRDVESRRCWRRDRRALR